jgi:hypothetical protein
MNMNKLGKKLVAGTLSATMVLGSTLAVFAEDTDTTTLPSGAQSLATGTGTSEGYVVLDVTKVVLPAAATVNYAIDPQGLLNKADSNTYGTAGAAVYFTNAATTDDGSATYSDTSDALTIKNKSSYAVDVTLTVGVKNGSSTALSDIKLVDKDALATATDPSLYLGVIAGDKTTAVTSDGQTVTATAMEVPEVNGDDVTSGYKLVATKTAKDGVTPSELGYYYYYDLTDGYTPGDDQTVSFKLTGAVNGVEAWKDVTETVVTSLTYTIEKHVDKKAPSIANTTPTVSAKTDTVTVSYDLGVGGLAATGVSSVVNKAAGAAVPTARYSINTDDKTITFDATFVTNNYDAIESTDGLTITVTFDDASNTPVDITIKTTSEN